ncbi:UDP-glucose,sterol transferase [Hypoxylon trugodes]|uniref:UDP-glucose,sterol transferase n=1 Tax=Hypoxylon trugodes TaxID=326681 RepID=UPI002194DEB3|nr:UDP-glucose,sterol transferase [Hypoxylon trugodes]KAI1393363.1 UDP-glucose,sterol transferase [Hypoxylon trugodes]
MNNSGSPTSHEIPAEPSPAYQEFDVRHGSTMSNVPGIGVRDNGRVGVDISSGLNQRLSRLLTTYPTDFSQPDPVPSPKYLEEEQFPLRLNIVVQVIGSRGDVQPFVALGQELKSHGHRVRLATHDVFKSFVEAAGLEFFPVGGNPSELMAYMVRNPGLIPSIESLRAGDIQQKRKMIGEMLQNFWKSCIEPDEETGNPFVADAIISNPPSFAHVHCAQALGVPLHMMFTMPWTRTKAFAHPLANLANHNEDPRVANYLSYYVVEALTWQGLGDLVNDWRDQTLSLEPIPTTEGCRLLETLKVPFSYCWSPGLIPRPSDWDSSIDVCGFFFRKPPSYTPPEDLEKFLNSGPMPIYIGFGSIVVDDPDRILTIVLKAVQTLGIRAIISKGWSELKGTGDPNIFYIGDCPHEWLFQQVSAVVHHGGAGTTACGLLYGRPTVIVPFFGDQPFWGEMLARTGAGPKPVPYASLTSRKLADAIEYSLTPEAADAASKISESMKKESGVKRAVQFFHANLPLAKLTCTIFPDQPAAWSYKGKQNPILLSKRAENILTGRQKIDQKKLKLYKSHPIFIEPERWDPATAVSAALLATFARTANATAGVFTKPYEKYKEINGALDNLEEDRFGDAVTNKTAVHSKHNALNNYRTTKALASASACSAGKALMTWSRGIFVDVPVAATEGLRALPRAYDDVKPHGHVKGFKTGVSVAGEVFGQSVAGAVTDIVVFTYRGKKEEGPKGVAKGLAKGLFSIPTKTSAATLGLVAYPLQGLARSIHSATRTTTKEAIERAKRAEGAWFQKNYPSGIEDFDYVVADFESLAGRVMKSL